MFGQGIEKFRDEESAYEFVERHFWPDGPVCPHCGGTSRIGRLSGDSTRPRTYKCYECRKPFTVKVGTVFEDSKVPMHKWLQAILLHCQWRHRLNARQAGLILGVTYRTAAAMLQRVRAAGSSPVIAFPASGRGAPEARTPEPRGPDGQASVQAFAKGAKGRKGRS